MKTRPRSRALAFESLESRMVLSHGSGPISVVTNGLQGPTQGFVGGQAPSITTLVNTSFSTFLQSYSQARSVYFTAIQAHSTTTTSGDMDALKQYTHQSVELLAQQLLNNFQTAVHLKHQAHQADPPSIITQKIDGSTDSNGMTTFNAGTLGIALIRATPPTTASPDAIALSSLAQDNAIESARIAVINGLNLAKQRSAHH